MCEMKPWPGWPASTSATRLASALVHPGTPDPEDAPRGQLLAEDVVRGDPWGWFMAERASLVRMVEQTHAAWLWARTWQLAELLAVMFDWRADWRSWERTHQLALDAARQAGDADAEAGIMRSLGALYRELGRYDEAVIGIYHDLADRLEEARARIRYALVFRDQYLSEQAIPLLDEGLRVIRELGDRRWEARGLRQPAIVHRNDGDTKTAVGLFGGCLSIFGELEDRRGMAVVLRNRGDAWRLAGDPEEAASDLAGALEGFQAIGDRRWVARTQVSMAGVDRLRRDWTGARQHLDVALAAFGHIGDRPAEARALRRVPGPRGASQPAGAGTGSAPVRGPAGSDPCRRGADYRDARAGAGLRVAASSRRGGHRAGRHRMDRADGRLTDQRVRSGGHGPAAHPVLGARAAACHGVDRSRTGGLVRLQHRDRPRAGMAGS